jgi:allantoate deiminase
MYQKRATKILQQINELAAISGETDMITRVYGSDAFIDAGKKIIAWMQHAGLTTHADNMHNIRARLNCGMPNAQTLLIASHFDTVVNAGKFDGPLGIIMGLDIIENLVQTKTALPFNIELVAFCDEEGVRFHTTYLGSKVMAGSFDKALLSKKDNDGITLKALIKKLGGDPDKLDNDSLAKEDLLGYFEIHIEQGPVLYESGIPVAVVTAIAGQKRAELIFTGVAGHAGTVPMDMRQDALCCAAECITAIETFAINNKTSIVATVGKLEVSNAASNVVPGQVKCTLDVRSADESALSAACDALNKKMTGICSERNISFEWKSIQETGPVVCDPAISKILKQSIEVAGYEVVELVSGAGHDAVALSVVCPVCMMFVRCFKGISHNPLEDVEIKDIEAAIKVSDNFLFNLITNFNK